jgi:hypothetical protein
MEMVSFRKIAAVFALVVAIVGSTVAAVLDLPANTPGRRVLHNRNPYLEQKNINNILTPCEVVTIAIPNLFIGANIPHPPVRLYFSTNGVQPTTPEAVEYSCANIDNRENSPITEWYMMMFGVPIANLVAGNPIPGAVVQAGWTNPRIGNPVAQGILTFNASVDETMVNDPNNPNAQITRRDLFIREFRKIASTPVGRVLLYRILIEIRRHNPGGNVGCSEDDRYLVDDTVGRRAIDRCRSIDIMHMPTFGFDDTAGAIFFYDNPNNIAGTTPLVFSVIGKSVANYTHIVQAPTTLDVVIFHEMIHWFHHLRNPKRYYEEINSGDTKSFNSMLPIHQYYWDGIAIGQTNQNYKRIWSAGNFNAHLDFEEMRNLLGMPHDFVQNCLRGDDLSENLYRINRGLPLRFGYSGTSFYEDKRVIDRVINACMGNCIVYITGKSVNINQNDVDFAYGAGVQCFGIHSNGRVRS